MYTNYVHKQIMYTLFCLACRRNLSATGTKKCLLGNFSSLSAATSSTSSTTRATTVTDLLVPQITVPPGPLSTPDAFGIKGDVLSSTDKLVFTMSFVLIAIAILVVRASASTHVCLHWCLSVPSLSVCLSLYVCPHLCLSVCLIFVCLSTSVSVCLHLCLPMCIFVCLCNKHLTVKPCCNKLPTIANIVL